MLVYWKPAHGWDVWIQIQTCGCLISCTQFPSPILWGLRDLRGSMDPHTQMTSLWTLMEVSWVMKRGRNAHHEADKRSCKNWLSFKQTQYTLEYTYTHLCTRPNQSPHCLSDGGGGGGLKRNYVKSLQRQLDCCLECVLWSTQPWCCWVSVNVAAFCHRFPLS